MKSLKYLVVIVVAMMLGACASTPTQYLTLAPLPESTPPAIGTTDLQMTGLPVVIAHVQMPADLDRLYLTTLTGNHRMRVANHIRWVAPLEGMAQKVLAQDLAAELPGKTVYMPGDPAPKGQYLLVRLNILHFLPDSNGKVTLEADWFIERMPSRQILAQARSRLIAASTFSATDQAAAMSRLIGRLAHIMATRL